jgi:hypothetical protein
MAADRGRGNRTPANGKARQEPARPASTGGKPGLLLTCLADVAPEPVEYLVEGYIPLGKVCIVAGDGGLGKSTVSIDLAACITTGDPALGLAYRPEVPPSEALFICCEDDAADTILPRLLAHGADRSKVFKVDGYRDEGGKLNPFSLADYDLLESCLTDRPSVRLVVVDPVTAYVGKRTDDHRDSELRAMLGPLAELAARRNVTILLIAHLNKAVGNNIKAAYRVAGSAGYLNSVRAGFLVGPTQDDPDVRVLAPIKFNLGPAPPSLSFATRPLSDGEASAILDCYPNLKPRDRQRLARQLFRVRWLGPVETSADELLAGGPGRARTKVQECADWLLSLLQEFAYPVREVDELAKSRGFTSDNVKEAKVILKDHGVMSTNQGEFGGEWWMGIGLPDTWQRRPEPSERQNP